jgi:cell wall-associated NlpC family hydrolase
MTTRRLALLASLPLTLCAALFTPVLTTDADPTPTTCTASSTPTNIGLYGPEQLRNATTIITIGHERTIPTHGILTALMAAMTESALHNVNHGDRDSLGLFQMRPSMGWGTPTQILNPTYATNKFYDVLLTIPNWQQLPPGDAAQAVERSAYPERYAKHEPTARTILREIGEPCSAGPASESTADIVIAAALSQLGVPYAWGGGDAEGPTRGTGVDRGVTGFDCSGLALYAYAQAGITLPHQTRAIWKDHQPAINDPEDVRPGDLVLLSNNHRPSGIHHIGIYLGDGQIVHAPQSGDVVRIATDAWRSSYWSREFLGAVRPT